MLNHVFHASPRCAELMHCFFSTSKALIWSPLERNGLAGQSHWDIIFSSTASWCKLVSCCNLQHTSNLLGHLWFQSQPSFFGSFCKDKAAVAVKGSSWTIWRQIYPIPPALGVVSSSLRRDIMGRIPTSTVVNTFDQQEIPALSDGCSFILVLVTIPEPSSSCMPPLRIMQSGSWWHFLRLVWSLWNPRLLIRGLVSSELGVCFT